LVKRSLITLRALTNRDTGGIVAAGTTSLPEEIGGTRNWDYRYCWLRDATLTLRALVEAGFTGEAGAWRDWLLRAVAGDATQLRIMYGIAGEQRRPKTNSPGCKVMREAYRCASATPPAISCSSMFTARSSTPSIWRGDMGWQKAPTGGGCSACWSVIWRRYGGNRTRASGKFEVRD